VPDQPDAYRLRREFLDAIGARDVDRVAAAGAALRRAGVAVPLEVALDMVVVAGEQNDARFRAWSRRWSERVRFERALKPPACEEIQRLLKLVPTQNEARAVTLALRRYTGRPRLWE